MSTAQSTHQQLESQVNWPSIIQLILSALAALLLFSAATLIVTTSVVQYYSRGSGTSELTQPFMLAASLAFVGVLVLPSAWYAGKRLVNPGWEPVIRPERRGFTLILTVLVLVLVSGALLLGNWVSQNNYLTWILLPMLNIIATGLPVLWLVYIGTRGLSAGSPERKWGAFASGLVVAPAIILILEIIVLIGMGILAIGWILVDPSLASQLNSLVFRLQNGAPNEQAILRILLPFLFNPGILFITFATISVLSPIIEEALKPIGVWFLAGRRLTPAQGFAYGILSGSAFGLFENLGTTSNGGELWALLTSSRITPLLLHSLTAGLVGWALASAWSQKRYLRLGVTYAFTVTLHGLWNAMAILAFLSSLEGLTNISMPVNLQQIGTISSIGIVSLSAFNLVLFIGFNAILRNGLRRTASPLTSDGEPPNPPENGSISPKAGEPDETPSTPNNPVSPLLGDTQPMHTSELNHVPTEENPPSNLESNL